jgi:hypothetical protein
MKIPPCGQATSLLFFVSSSSSITYCYKVFGLLFLLLSVLLENIFEEPSKESCISKKKGTGDIGIIEGLSHEVQCLVWFFFCGYPCLAPCHFLHFQEKIKWRHSSGLHLVCMLWAVMLAPHEYEVDKFEMSQMPWFSIAAAGSRCATWQKWTFAPAVMIFDHIRRHTLW